ncbi:UDP-glucose 4-epimerase GalE [Sphingomonas naphthae]|uniref:UDP-glucose 4-epimerase n=1 Tax=Sphingomonas naphthae TaxID=1813468 RepID=A0ABY7TLE3_9SPHN|nr:UDP-glucose 4-epimerase GalE [Sphingomonas naphthae]WCT74047.1 UDP-glucose 4-epimerase GalE [Sphingomonas naphthae]
MKVLVTGGAGYIGSHTAKRLAEHGHTPITFDNLSTGHRALARFGPLVVGDVTDPAALDAAISAHRPEAIVHFAALSQVGESMQRPELYFRNNVGGTVALVEAALRGRIGTFVFSSTAATYGIPSHVPILETQAVQPINPYGESKLACEMLLRSASAAHGLSCTALRYFNAAGADPGGLIGEAHDPETHAIPLLLMAAAGKRAGFAIFGDDYDTPDGTCIRDYLHVTDLAEAHVRALTLSGAARFEAINLGTGHGQSVRELVDAARAVTGRDFRVEARPRRAGDPPSLVADAGKALDLLGWKAEHSSLDHIMRTAWDWTNAPANPLHNRG